jgi:hypothetical protein
MFWRKGKKLFATAASDGEWKSLAKDLQRLRKQLTKQILHLKNRHLSADKEPIL